MLSLLTEIPVTETALTQNKMENQQVITKENHMQQRGNKILNISKNNILDQLK